MAVFSAFQAMRLILLVSVLYDAVGKSCHSSFSCLKDQVCCDHKCIYGSDCLGSLCALDSDCSVGQSCCSNKCKHGLHCVGSRCSESNDCGVYESCCFGTCSYDVDCKLYRTIELVGIICGATMLLCVIFVCVFWAYHRRHTRFVQLWTVTQALWHRQTKHSHTTQDTWITPFVSIRCPVPLHHTALKQHHWVNIIPTPVPPEQSRGHQMEKNADVISHWALQTVSEDRARLSKTNY